MTPTASLTLTMKNSQGAPMYAEHSLAQTEQARRLAEAERLRRQLMVARARRLSRKAERAALRARLALARVGA